MLILNRLSLVVLTSLLVAAMTACTSDDEIKQEEEIAPTATEEAAAPELDAGLADTSSSLDPNSVILFFSYDEAIVSEADKTRLNELSEMLKKNPSLKVQIAGHADERGSIEYNLALGDRRANAAKDYLIAMGVNSSQVQTISYGEEKPATEGHTEEAWTQNRRANFETLSH